MEALLQVWNEVQQECNKKKNKEISMEEKSDIDIFFEYLNTTDVIFRDGICITDLDARKHWYSVLPITVSDVIINPNHTFIVLFKNGAKHRYKFYTLTPHFHSAENPNCEEIVEHTTKGE